MYEGWNSEVGSHHTQALTVQVHTSANAVLMKPFITSSQLNQPLSPLFFCNVCEDMLHLSLFAMRMSQFYFSCFFCFFYCIKAALVQISSVFSWWLFDM